MMGATTGRMSQTNPDLQPIPYKRYVPQEGQVFRNPESRQAREEFANYFCKFDWTGQVPKLKEENEEK